MPTPIPMYLIPCVLLLILVLMSTGLAKVSDPDFRFGNEPSKFGVYRMIGNEFLSVAPVPSFETIRKNLHFVLKYEPNLEHVSKRWILNGIMNENQFQTLYADLVEGGVHRWGSSFRYVSELSHT